MYTKKIRRYAFQSKLSWLLIVTISLLSMPMLSIGAEAPKMGTFNLIDDAHVRSAKYSGTNYSTNSILEVKDATGENYRKAYLKFDLTSLRSSYAVTSAKLKLYGKGASVQVGIFGVDNDNWEEESVTWDTAPAMSTEEIGRVTLSNNSSYKPYEIDVTNYVQNQMTPDDGIVSFGLDCITWDTIVSFYSKENSSNLPAQLMIEYVDAGPRILQTIPQSGNKLFTHSSAYIDFDKDMEMASVTDKSNVFIMPAVNYELSYDSDEKRCIVSFPDGLAETEYTITLKGGLIKSAEQEPLVSDKTIIFTATPDALSTPGINLTQHADSAYGEAQVTNNRSQASNAEIIIALYDKDKGTLLDIQSQHNVIDAGATANMQTPVMYVPQGTDRYYFKSFLWSDLMKIEPLVQSAQADNLGQFDLMRDEMKTMLTGGSYLELNDPSIAENIAEKTQTAQQLWNNMYKNDDRTCLWPGVAFGSSSANLTTSYTNLKSMAIAYATVGSGLYRNQQLLQDIISGLEWMNENVYNTTATRYDNWWDWQLGVPLRLNDCVILIYDTLSEEQRTRYMDAIAFFKPDITLTGANRAWECEIFTARGIITRDPSLLEKVRTAFGDLLSMVTSGDGFYEDGSFIQHTTVPYNGGYGRSLLEEITKMLCTLHGSPWEINEIAKSNVYRWVQDAFEPFLYKGALMDMVRGREISRNYAETHYIGHSTMTQILRLSQIAPEKYAKSFQSMVKYLIVSDTAKDFLDDADIDVIPLAKSILNDPTIESRGELIKYNQFYNMDRAVQFRPGYGVGISMFSSRISNYEMINDENIKGYHTSDGMVYLYNNDLLQFSENFWPTINKYRLPGTTVLNGSSVSANIRGTKPWVGGTQLMDLYGVSGMDMSTPGTTLKAKKSWFMFDNEIVSLGAGISSTDGINVETIVENRKINGENQFIVNGTEKPTNSDWSETMENTQWAYLQGNTEGSDIGYYFPQGGTIQALRETRTGSWKDMSKAGSSASLTAKYLTMWFDYGINPENGTYSYVTLPNMTQEQTKNYAQNPDVTILENSDYVQAVKETKQNMIGANFWTDTLQSADKITCDKQASVMMRETSDDMEISVADPTQLNTQSINVEIKQSATGILSADDNISVQQLSPTIKFSVNVKGSKGKSYQAKFALVDPISQQPEKKDVYIVDNTDNGFSTDGIPWALNSTTTGYYGANAATDNTAAADESRWAKWTPNILAADTYDIYIRWVSASNRPDTVPLEIKYDGGIDTSKSINQKYNNGIWVYIGSYPLSKGGNNYVKIGATDSGYTSADAVKFVARNATGNTTPY